MITQINEAIEYLKKHGITAPEVGIILGTGLGNKFVEKIKNPISINYNSIPHFPISTVEYHKGKLIYGDVKGRKCWPCRVDFIITKGTPCNRSRYPCA
jgi:purine-nucleoside phosphorylase